MFGEILNVQGTLWLIPEIANKVLYMKQDGNFEEFDIRDEDETEFSQKNRCLNVKYNVLYIRKERYIGIFSCKNEHIVEIDTLNKSYTIKKFLFYEIPFAAYRPEETNARTLSWLLDGVLCSELSNSRESAMLKQISIGKRILSDIVFV